MGMPLTRDQIDRLNRWRFRYQLDVVKFKLAMDAPFKWPTLKAALAGKPIGDATRRFIANWIDAHEPSPAQPVDGKSRAAGENAA